MIDDPQARKATLAAVFDRSARSYSEIVYFPKFGRRLVELAQLGNGAQVLDVACGRGAVLFPAAERVGPSGQVTGIDISAGMVRETAAEIDRRHLTQARALPMDAESLTFPDASFDVVTCAFALFFFPRLDRALAEFRRVLKPGGRIAVSTWGEDDPRWDWYDDLGKAYDAVISLRTHALDRADDLRAAVHAAGFSRIQMITEAPEEIYPNEDAFWAMIWSTSARAGLERLDPAALARFKAEVDAGLGAMMQPDGLHERQQAHFALATSS